MNPDTERKVAVFFTVDNDFLWPIKHFRIPVTRSEWKKNFVSRHYRTSSNFGIFSGDARHGHRRVSTKKFFYCRRDQFRFRHKTLPVIVMGREVKQIGSDRTPCRVNTRNQQKKARTQYMFICERVSIGKGLCLKLANQVVTRIHSTIGNCLIEIFKDFFCRCG